MKLIKGWFEKKLTCSRCKSDKSVKYEHNGKPYCNICIIKIKPWEEE
jgi:uncharacterized Zn finger protein (UPF0148 family)